TGDSASSESADTVSSTPVADSGSSTDPFAMVPIRPEVRLDPAATTDDGLCQTYESSSPPFTMVADLADDLEAAGWTVTDRFDTGKLYDATASATATKEDLTLRISAAGTGSTSASMSLCLEA
nr:hypothetical protein [Acidimicrobiia bacterium]